MERGGLRTILFLLLFETAFSLRMIIGMLCISSSPADASSLMPSCPGYDTVSKGGGALWTISSWGWGLLKGEFCYLSIFSFIRARIRSLKAFKRINPPASF